MVKDEKDYTDCKWWTWKVVARLFKMHNVKGQWNRYLKDMD